MTKLNELLTVTSQPLSITLGVKNDSLIQLCGSSARTLQMGGVSGLGNAITFGPLEKDRTEVVAVSIQIDSKGANVTENYTGALLTIYWRDSVPYIDLDFVWKSVVPDRMGEILPGRIALVVSGKSMTEMFTSTPFTQNGISVKVVPANILCEYLVGRVDYETLVRISAYEEEIIALKQAGDKLRAAESRLTAEIKEKNDQVSTAFYLLEKVFGILSNANDLTDGTRIERAQWGWRWLEKSDLSEQLWRLFSVALKNSIPSLLVKITDFKDRCLQNNK